MTEANRGKRVAKNTALLYLRMIIVMMVSLFTSRVILAKLGVEDYGIYNLVGGVVAMFGVLSSSLVASVSRFLTYDLGTGDIEHLRKTYSISLIVLTIMAIGIALLIEIIGVWFLNTQLNIPAERMQAANFVLQCSILSFVVGIIVTPFSALVVAHERMGVYAYLSLTDVFIKLAILYALSFFPFDRLETYAVLLMLAGFVTPVFNFIYCKRKFNEAQFSFVWDKDLIRQLGAFTGWSVFGQASWMANTQGVNMLINMFFGVTLNAARGIASQVEGGVQTFVSNFTMAINPQVTKSYAAGDLEYMRKLIFVSARLSFCMVLFFAIPICLEVHQILVLWLKTVPPYTEIFVQLTLLNMLAMMLTNPLTSAQNATGHIKKYSIVMSSTTMMVFPLTYIAFKLGLPPFSTYIIFFIVYFSMIFFKVWLVKGFIGITYKDYLVKVVLRTLLVALTSLALPLFLRINMASSPLRLIVVSLASIVCTLFFTYGIGLFASERTFVNQKITAWIRR